MLETWVSKAANIYVCLASLEPSAVHLHPAMAEREGAGDEHLGKHFQAFDEPGARRVLTAEEQEAWLRALNDTRLVLGERLGITEDWDEMVAGLVDDDPRLPLFLVYDRLTYLQEMLVQSLW